MAEGPVQPVNGRLGKARKALAAGEQDLAIDHGIAALKLKPLGAAENVQMSLAMFWLARFDDSVRYLRRALAANPDCLNEEPVLAARIPAKDVNPRINELARAINDKADLCFLAGALLLVNQDQERAFALLLRAEELAGTDGQATDLMNDLGKDPQPDRSQRRALNAITRGDFKDGLRSFAFAAMDRPTRGDFYAGMALCLGARGESLLAMEFIEQMRAHATSSQFLKWWHRAAPEPAKLLAAAAKLETPDQDGQAVPLQRLQLAMLLYFGAGYYASAKETSVHLLLQSKLHNLTHDLRGYMHDEALKYNPGPIVEPPSSVPGPDPDESAKSMRLARGHLQKGEYAEAMNQLDPLVTEETSDPEIFYLLFVALVGRSEFKAASSSLGAWLISVNDQQRLRRDALSELFAQSSTYDRWSKLIDGAVGKEPRNPMPVALRCYVRISEGRYTEARIDLAVATIWQDGTDRSIAILDRLLDLPETRKDSGSTEPEADPKEQFAAAEELFKKKDYQGAKSLYLKAAEQDPDLAGISVALFRAWFALGDSAQAAKQLLVLLAEQKIETGSAGDFRLNLRAAYRDQGEFAVHLKALSDECDRRNLSTDPWLVLGAVEFGRGPTRYGAAADALQVWSDNVTGERNAAALKLLAYAEAKRR